MVSFSTLILPLVLFFHFQDKKKSIKIEIDPYQIRNSLRQDKVKSRNTNLIPQFKLPQPIEINVSFTISPREEDNNSSRIMVSPFKPRGLSKPSMFFAPPPSKRNKFSDDRLKTRNNNNICSTEEMHKEKKSIVEERDFTEVKTFSNDSNLGNNKWSVNYGIYKSGVKPVVAKSSYSVRNSIQGKPDALNDSTILGDKSNSMEQDETMMKESMKQKPIVKNTLGSVFTV